MRTSIFPPHIQDHIRKTPDGTRPPAAICRSLAEAMPNASAEELRLALLAAFPGENRLGAYYNRWVRATRPLVYERAKPQDRNSGQDLCEVTGCPRKATRRITFVEPPAHHVRTCSRHRSVERRLPVTTLRLSKSAGFGDWLRQQNHLHLLAQVKHLVRRPSVSRAGARFVVEAT